MIGKLLVLSSCLMLSAWLHAQTASYSTFGSGCPGTGQAPCLSNNPQGGKQVPLLSIGIIQYAFEAKSARPLLVSGFEMMSRTLRNQPVTVSTRIYLQNSTNKGPQPSPTRSSTMQVGTSFQWYKTSFTPPLVLKPNEVFFLSYLESNTSRILWPRIQKGTSSPHWQRNGGQGPWAGPRSGIWAWKVNCVGSGGAVPLLSNRGVPSLGKTFNIDLGGARASTGAVLNFGASKSKWGPFNLPLNLNPFGAPGCMLWSSPDVMLGTGTDGTGHATVLVPVPSSSIFSGRQFFNQWMVIDPTVNRLKLVFSNAGAGVIGR
ncbi:MAG: hypothetical protein ACE5F1_10220 [Planctomycetota bacterium]